MTRNKKNPVRQTVPITVNASSRCSIDPAGSCSTGGVQRANAAREHVGDSCGDSVEAGMHPVNVSVKDCANGCSSSRVSPASTLTSEVSISAGWNQVKFAASKDVQEDGVDAREGRADIREDESMDTEWTDDRHSSYLNSMEEMFVRNMYDREYCALDICGQAASSQRDSCEQDCVESRLTSSAFKVMQKGDWHPLPARRLHSWELPAPTIVNSPWIQHFKAKSGTQDEQAEKTTEESIICRTCTAFELDEDAPEVPDVEDRLLAWRERFNSHPSASSNEPVRKNVTGNSYKAQKGCTRSKQRRDSSVYSERSQRSESSAKASKIQLQALNEEARMDQVVPVGHNDKTWHESRVSRKKEG